MGPKVKYIFIIVIFLLVSILAGCTSKNTIDKDKLDSMVEDLVNETNLAIANEDIKKARQVWSEVTELSIKAKDYKEISEAIEKLSTNYVKLITYLETGEDYLLNDFRKEFSIALEELKSILYTLTEEGEEKAEKPFFL